MKKVDKKLLAFCISVSLCAAALSGCGTGSVETNAEVQTVSQEQATTEEQQTVLLQTEEQILAEVQTTEEEQKVQKQIRFTSNRLPISRMILSVVWTHRQFL